MSEIFVENIRDGNQPDVATASVQLTVKKPVAAAACFPQLPQLNLSTSVNQETAIKQVDCNELSGREANSVIRSLCSGET